MNTVGKSPIWVLHLLSVWYLFYVNTVTVYELKYDTSQWACNIQRLPGSDVGHGADLSSTLLCLVEGWGEQGCHWAVEEHMDCCRSCMVERRAVGSQAKRVFGVSTEVDGTGLRTCENPQLFLLDLLEASENCEQG